MGEGGDNRVQRVIAGRRLSRGEGVHMPFVQVSVRQTEYTSKNELQIQNNATLSSCLLQQQNINISGSISPPYEHFYAHTITTMQQPIRAGNINICYRYK